MKIYRRRRSPYWWATWVDLDGERHRRSTGCMDKRAAQRVAAQLVIDDERKRVTPKPRRRRQETIGEALDDWLADVETASDYSESYRRSLAKIARGHIRPALGQLRLDALDPPRIVEWRDDLARGSTARGRRSTATVNRIVYAFRAFLRWAVERGRLTSNPADGLSPLKERPIERHRALTDAVLDQWCAEIVRGDPEYRLHDPERALGHVHWLRFLCETGLRQGEGRIVTRGMVDIERRHIRLAADQTKGASSRLVPLTGRALAILDALGVEAMPADALVFGTVSRRGALEGAWKRTGLPGRCPSDHDFRHTAASVWIAAGATLAEVQAALGHKSPTTTARYIHRYGQGTADLARRIDTARR